MRSSKKLVLLGSGIKSISHLTHEAKAYMSQADKVLYLLNEPLMEQYIQQLSSTSESLEEIYFGQSNRSDSYQNIVNYIIEQSANTGFLCVAIYGHPTVFASPGLQAIKQAQSLGVETLVLPGISAEDCLFADLGIDPGQQGCYSIEVTELLLHQRALDPYSHVILWQPAMLANLTHDASQKNQAAMALLQQKLIKLYSSEHPIVVYEAAIYPGMSASIERYNLGQLLEVEFSTLSTLYIAPLEYQKSADSMLKLLNLAG